MKKIFENPSMNISLFCMENVVTTPSCTNEQHATDVLTDKGVGKITIKDMGDNITFAF